MKDKDDTILNLINTVIDAIKEKGGITVSVTIEIKTNDKK